MGEVIEFPRQQPRPTGGEPLDGTERQLPSHSGPGARTEPDPLWRDLVGAVLREERLRGERTQAEVAEAAGISTQYLSEVERGRKEPSSEVLGAVTGALGLRLGDLTSRVTRRLATYSGPVCLAA